MNPFNLSGIPTCPPRAVRQYMGCSNLLFVFFITLGLELSDSKVYEPQIRALLGTASHHSNSCPPTHSRASFVKHLHPQALTHEAWSDFGPSLECAVDLLEGFWYKTCLVQSPPPYETCLVHLTGARPWSGAWVRGHGPWAMGHGPWVMGHGLWVMGHGLGVSVVDCRLYVVGSGSNSRGWGMGWGCADHGVAIVLQSGELYAPEA